MRVSGLLILLMIVQLSVFSQTLKPRILIKDKDTLFGFDQQQAKALAKAILKARGCDSLALAYERSLMLSDSLVMAQNRLISNTNMLVDNKSQTIRAQDQQIKLYLDQAVVLKKQIKRQKLQKYGAFTLCLLFGYLAIK